MTKQDASEDGETTSVAEAVKSLFKKNKKVIIGAVAIVATGLFIKFRSMGEPNKRDGDEGWSKEGADWFNNLPWEDALYLLTRQEDDVRDEEDEQRLGRIRESYEKATGYKWE
ncbi:hypothetical protein [Streptomyces sp. NPDC048411]|uniref:hypothetical protein n=1 Tax=Streptomyces sp. NPDC048411 TaxID=3157206 RepID=UPI003455AE19